MPLTSLTATGGFAMSIQEQSEPSMPAAFASVVERHSAMVLGVCRRMLGDADAEDAAQAVFILFWQKALRFQEEAQIAGWLHRTAQHVCRNAQRSRASRIKHEQQAAVESHSMPPEPVEMAHWKEIQEILDAEVNQLPDKFRIPFVLFHCENRSLAEVADLVGSTVPTVGTWLQRSRERLADRLRKRRIVIGAAALAALFSQHSLAAAVPTAFVATSVQAVSDISAIGLTAGTPAVVSLVKSGASGGLSKVLWISATLFAAVVGFPLVVVWLLPAIQTWQSPDYPLLQGEWMEVASEQNGEPAEALPRVEYVGRLQISGRHFQRTQTLTDGTVLPGGSGAFVLDSSQHPAAIDFRQWPGTAYGIYELDGDSLTLCVTRSGGPRPDDLSTSKNDDRILSRYQKVR